MEWVQSQDRLWAAIVLIPLLLVNLHIWTFAKGSFLLPLDLNFFEWSFDAWHQNRPVLPLWSQHIFFFLNSFFGFGLALACFLMIREIVPGASAFRMATALLVLALLYPWAAPGQSPIELIEFSYALLLLALSTKLGSSPLKLAVLGGLALFLSWTHPFFWMNAFWCLVTALLSSPIVFLFGERAHISFRSRLNWTRSLSFAIALILFAALGALSFLSQSWPSHRFGFADWWWLSYLNLALVLFCAWRDPWATALNLRLALLGMGALVSPDLQLLSLLTISFSLFRSLCIWGRNWEWKPSLRLALYTSSILVSITLALLFLIIHKDNREFKPGWVALLGQVEDNSPEGLIVYGNALPYLAHFYAGPMDQNPDLWEMADEEAWINWMEERSYRHILIDTQFLRNEWRKKIDEGLAPEKISQSILSRIVINEGQAMETATLQFPALEKLEIASREPEGFLWVRRTDRP